MPLESRNANAYVLWRSTIQSRALRVSRLTAFHSTGRERAGRDSRRCGYPACDRYIELGCERASGFSLWALTNTPQPPNIRGTIEFDTPAGAQIGALGIRIPVAHTFTTLPALVK